MVTWQAFTKALITGYAAWQSAEDRKKAKEHAEKGQSQTRSPYMAEMINPILPYILQEALGVYGQRAQKGGRTAGNYDLLLQMLQRSPYSPQAQPQGWQGLQRERTFNPRQPYKSSITAF